MQQAFSLPAVLAIPLNLTTPAEKAVWGREAGSPGGGEGGGWRRGHSGQRELTVVPPVLEVSFHSLPLLGPSHPGVQDTEKPPVRAGEAELEAREELAQAMEWTSLPLSCPDRL